LLEISMSKDPRTAPLSRRLIVKCFITSQRKGSVKVRR
jgi:hypothetical protein